MPFISGMSNLRAALRVRLSSEAVAFTTRCGKMFGFAMGASHNRTAACY